LGDLERLKLVIDYLPDEELMQALEDERGNGRNDYPVRVVWNSMLAGIVFQHKTTESLRRELMRNGQLRQICGFDIMLDVGGVPSASAYTRFLCNLMKHEKEVDGIFNSLVRMLCDELPGFGEVLAIDGKALESYARPRRAESEKPYDGRRDIDANFGVKTYKAKIAAETDSTVLICGEAGTGKEMFAHAVHNRGKQARGPFIPMNCGAMPRDLVGRELFGYEDGAFTGAAPGGRPGRLELASGGTLFLDEIGDMPLEQQVAFHRALQDKMVTRLGGANMTEVDVRVICATNKNLQHEVARGDFRPDLYNRLNVICILLPPLRERQEDIPLLFNFFLSRAMARLELDIHKVDAEVIDHLCAYEWPGNVRELQSVVERMVNTATAGHVGLEHLPGEILQPEHSEIAPSYLGSRFSDAIPATFEQHRARIRHSAQERQREELLKVLEKHDGNITRAAEEMGVSRNTIYRRMMRLDLQR
jgi:DNA-binding NtrC family response regulator